MRRRLRGPRECRGDRLPFAVAQRGEELVLEADGSGGSLRSRPLKLIVFPPGFPPRRTLHSPKLDVAGPLHVSPAEVRCSDCPMGCLMTPRHRCRGASSLDAGPLVAVNVPSYEINSTTYRRVHQCHSVGAAVLDPVLRVVHDDDTGAPHVAGMVPLSGCRVVLHAAVAVVENDSPSREIRARGSLDFDGFVDVCPDVVVVYFAEFTAPSGGAA